MEVSVNSMLRPLYPGKKTRCPLNKTLVGAAEPAWTFLENKKCSLYLQGFKFWTVQLVATALLRSSGKVQLLALPCL